MLPDEARVLLRVPLVNSIPVVNSLKISERPPKLSLACFYPASHKVVIINIGSIEE